MRRKKDDKRVLRSGNGRQQNSRRRISIKPKRPSYPKRDSVNRRDRPKRNPMNRRDRPKRKANKSLVFLMIIALVAFVIGAGMGVSLSFDDGADEGPHYKNVTKDMTSNLNETEDIYYDENFDAVDFNENKTSQMEIEIKSNEEPHT